MNHYLDSRHLFALQIAECGWVECGSSVRRTWGVSWWTLWGLKVSGAQRDVSAFTPFGSEWVRQIRTCAASHGHPGGPRQLENLCKLTRFGFKACLHSSRMFLDIKTFYWQDILTGEESLPALSARKSRRRCERGFSRHTCVISSLQEEETLHRKADGLDHFICAAAWSD